MTTMGTQPTANISASNVLRVHADSTQSRKGSGLDADSFLKMILDLGVQREVSRSSRSDKQLGRQKVEKPESLSTSENDDEQEEEKVSDESSPMATTSVFAGKQTLILGPAHPRQEVEIKKALASTEEAVELKGGQNTEQSEKTAFQAEAILEEEDGSIVSLNDEQGDQEKIADVSAPVVNYSGSNDQQSEASDQTQVRSDTENGISATTAGKNEVLQEELTFGSSAPSPVLEEAIGQEETEGKTDPPTDALGNQIAANSSSDIGRTDNKNNPPPAGSRLSADFYPDEKQSIGYENQKDASYLKPSATESGPANIAQVELAAKDQSNFLTGRLFPQTNPVVDTAATADVTAPQQNSADPLTSFETDSSMILKNFSFAPAMSETSGSQSTQPSLEEMADVKMAYESALSRIGSASAQEFGNQLGQNRQFKEGMFTFMMDGMTNGASGTAPMTGQAARTFSLGSSTWPMEMAQLIGELDGQKKSHLTLELEPKQLGRILLRVETEQNQVTASISTESEHVKQLLDRGTALLRQQLESQGLELGQLTINVNQGQSDRSFHRRSSSGAKTKQNMRPVPRSNQLSDMARTSSDQGSSTQLISVFA